MKKRIRFIIPGNQEDVLGNPIGYTRTTQRSKWTEKSRRYEAWKEYVWKCVKTVVNTIPRYEEDEKIALECRIWYKNKRRPDPGNVVKGIADALADKKLTGERCTYQEQRLYHDDKNVMERTISFDYNKGFPRVEVEIYSIEPEW
tara:strand:+ start:361 stop:795 length:435 start_codon:yes stop_codon:yes gene_type:complete